MNGMIFGRKSRSKSENVKPKVGKAESHWTQPLRCVHINMALWAIFKLNTAA